MQAHRVCFLAAGLMAFAALGVLSIGSYSFNSGPPARAPLTRQSAMILAEAVQAFSEGSSRRLPASVNELIAAGYLHAAVKDGWGRPLVYILRDDGSAVIGSLGADGRAGGGWLGSDDLVWLVRCRDSRGAMFGDSDPRWLVPVQNAEFHR